MSMAGQNRYHIEYSKYQVLVQLQNIGVDKNSDIDTDYFSIFYQYLHLLL